MENVEEFLNLRSEEFLRLYKAACLAYWNASLSGKEKDYRTVAETEIKINEFFNSNEDFEKIKIYLERSLDDGLLNRQLKVFYDSYLSKQGSLELLSEITNKVSEVEKKFNTFRCEFDGVKIPDSKVNKILKEDLDSDHLEAVWSGHKAVGEIVKDEVLEIVKIRNRLAKSLGFDNYYDFSLEVNEQNEGEIESVFDELDELIKESFGKLKSEIDLSLSKKYGIEVGDLKPWHYGDLFFQEGPSIYSVDLDDYYKEDILEKAKKYYESLGMDVRDILERSSLYEAEGKYPHAYCIDMDRRGDVRTMQNLKNNEQWMETLLHELGHAVYGKYMNFDLPIILRDSAHIFVTEAVAMIFGRKSRSADFIKNLSDKPFGENLKEEMAKALRLRQLVFSRWAQVMFRFERELYKNPEQDLNKLWWDLVSKYQLIDFSRDKADWASKIHIVSAPVYYHNYMLGEMLASQLHHYIMENLIEDKSKDSYFGCEKVGDYFKKEIFSHGAKYRWDELVRKATGEDLTAKYFVEEFV